MNRKRKASRSRQRCKSTAVKRKKSRRNTVADQTEDDKTVPDIHKCFLNYQQIANYLAQLADEFPHKIAVDEIGVSVKGNSILMAKILMASQGQGQAHKSCFQEEEPTKDQYYCCPEHECPVFRCEPDCMLNRSIAFVEAGSNGCDWISISTALYMIDRLVKSDGMRTNVDYFIVPCSNPDSYKASFTPGNALDNLSFNYPIILGEM
nr:unnamed protein product [Callosobruchus chinensis]